MVLEGVVTNVAAFGAFVDVGVHQDGLVHVSAMSRTFVSDPRSVVKPGDVVRVKVLSVDPPAAASRSPSAWTTKGRAGGPPRTTRGPIFRKFGPNGVALPAPGRLRADALPRDGR